MENLNDTAIRFDIEGKTGVSAFAKGGVVSGPPLAIIGGYPGELLTTEFIVPEKQLRSIFMESKSDVRQELTTRVRGK